MTKPSVLRLLTAVLFVLGAADRSVPLIMGIRVVRRRYRADCAGATFDLPPKPSRLGAGSNRGLAGNEVLEDDGDAWPSSRRPAIWEHIAIA